MKLTYFQLIAWLENKILYFIEKMQDDLVQSKEDQKEKEINNIELDSTSQTVTTEN